MKHTLVKYTVEVDYLLSVEHIDTNEEALQNMLAGKYDDLVPQQMTQRFMLDSLEISEMESFSEGK